MTAIKIDKKIKNVSVVSPDAPAPEAAPLAPPVSPALLSPAVVHMNEKVERPEILVGSTYKIKSPSVEHALYVTINDIVLNEDTEHEQRRPFEIFINSKNMEQFQWVVALTRIMSAVFRKGGDVTFLVEEMKAVFDPKGGYFKPGGVFMPSLIAEIGSVIEDHLKRIGVLEPDALSDDQRQMLAEKRASYEARTAAKAPVASNDAGPSEAPSFPATATMCNKCNTKAMIVMDGCQTCLNCGNSKCG